MYQDRKKYYQALEKARGSRLLVYVTGDRLNRQAQIGDDVIDLFVNHLDRIGDVEKLSLYFYTVGGITSAAWSLVNLIRQFCKTFEVIIPRKAHSAGTLICLGADTIMMTKQATLGPIDPSVNTPLNPVVGPEALSRETMPVSVEDINAYLDGAKHRVGDQTDLTPIFSLLSEKIHPLVLGQTFRTRDQIRMLGTKLLSQGNKNEVTINNILQFLCNESGSHDYTINRVEAKQLGLPIMKPDDNEYEIIKQIYDDIAEELELRDPYSPQAILGEQKEKGYKLTLALLESLVGGCNAYVSKGTLHKKTFETQEGIKGTALEDRNIFNRWEQIAAGGKDEQA